MNENKRDGVYLAGTAIEYWCNEGYDQSNYESACGVDGFWYPPIQCFTSKYNLYKSKTFLVTMV